MLEWKLMGNLIIEVELTRISGLRIQYMRHLRAWYRHKNMISFLVLFNHYFSCTHDQLFLINKAHI